MPLMKYLKQEKEECMGKEREEKRNLRKNGAEKLNLGMRKKIRS